VTFADPPPIALSPAIEALLAGDWAAFFATPGRSIYADATRRYHERVNDPRAFGAALAGRRLFPYGIDLGRIAASAGRISGRRAYLVFLICWDTESLNRPIYENRSSEDRVTVHWSEIATIL
jgi:hypothetical protein